MTAESVSGGFEMFQRSVSERRAVAIQAVVDITEISLDRY
jgi:hypothetical protein